MPEISDLPPQQAPQEGAISSTSLPPYANQLFDEGGYERSLYESFNIRKMHYAQGLDYAESGYHYVFMTKPDLNLDSSTVAALDIAYDHNFDFLADSLSWTRNRGTPWMFLITNLAKNAPLTDTTAESKTGFENFSGFSLSFGGRSTGSRVAGSFNISFQDLAGLPILNLMRVWTKYIEYAMEGLVERSELNRQRRVLDYASSVYTFTTRPDGETIEQWGKYTGIYPTGVPWTALEGNLGQNGIVTPDIPFSFTYYEDNAVEVLRDFAAIAENNYVQTSPNAPYEGPNTEPGPGAAGTEDVSFLSSLGPFGAAFSAVFEPVGAILSETPEPGDDAVSRVIQNEDGSTQRTDQLQRGDPRSGTPRNLPFASQPREAGELPENYTEFLFSKARRVNIVRDPVLKKFRLKFG